MTLNWRTTSGNIIGYATSVWVDYFCSYIPSNLSWRLPLSLQVIIGLILGFGGLLLPESPRWLLDVVRNPSFSSSRFRHSAESG